MKSRNEEQVHPRSLPRIPHFSLVKSWNSPYPAHTHTHAERQECRRGSFLFDDLNKQTFETLPQSAHWISLCHPPPARAENLCGNTTPCSIQYLQRAEYWSFSFSIIPSKESPGLISFRLDWLDLLAVQGTLKSLLQHHGSKASILRRSAFFTVQLSHPYMTTGKTIALTRRTFVGKVMSLLLNMLSRLVITFLPRSKHLLISWLQSPSAVILEPQK